MMCVECDTGLHVDVPLNSGGFLEYFSQKRLFLTGQGTLRAAWHATTFLRHARII